MMTRRPRRVTHRRSIVYPRSGLSMCRMGTTAAQLAALQLTTDDADVTCKRCLVLMRRRVERVR
jgi:hypothetical protein